MSEDGGSPRPPDHQMDVDFGTNSSIQGPIAPVSPVPSSNGKLYSHNYTVVYVLHVNRYKEYF